VKYLQIAGLMQSRIKVDKSNGIDKVFSPGLDLEKMEMQDVSGFDFNLPVQIFEKFYQDDDIEAEIIEDVASDDVTLVVPGGSGVTTGYYWIKNEVVFVYNVTPGATDSLSVFRSRYKTFSQKYTINESIGQRYFLRKYPKTFIGQRVFLWEDDKLLSIGLITQQPVFNQTTLSFTCENAISCLDVAWSIPPGSRYLGTYLDNGEEYEVISTERLNKSLNKTYSIDRYFEYELPPILDYLEISVKANITTSASNNTYIKLDNLDTILDYLKLYGKLNASVFTWNSTREAYTFMSISDISSLDTVEDVGLSKYVNTKTNYKSSIYSGIGQISVKLRNSTVNINNTNTSQYSRNDLEIDLSDFIGIKAEDVLDISFFYTRVFSVIYSELTIPTHELMFEHFREGRFYNALDIDKFYTFQNVSSKVFCLAKDEKNIVFLVTRDVIKNPIAPGIPVEAVTTSVLAHEDNLSEYLETYRENIEDAVIMDYNYPFFASGDNVTFIKESGAELAGLVINSINQDGIDFTGSPFIIGEKGYLTYNSYTGLPARQQKFFFLDQNNW